MSIKILWGIERAGGIVNNVLQWKQDAAFTNILGVFIMLCPPINESIEKIICCGMRHNISCEIQLHE